MTAKEERAALPDGETAPDASAATPLWVVLLGVVLIAGYVLGTMFCIAVSVLPFVVDAAMIRATPVADLPVVVAQFSVGSVTVGPVLFAWKVHQLMVEMPRLTTRLLLLVPFSLIAMSALVGFFSTNGITALVWMGYFSPEGTLLSEFAKLRDIMLFVWDQVLAAWGGDAIGVFTSGSSTIQVPNSNTTVNVVALVIRLVSAATLGGGLIAAVNGGNRNRREDLAEPEPESSAS